MTRQGQDQCWTSLRFALLLSAFVLWFTAGPLRAQVNLGSIRGTVEDTSRAAIPGAQLTLQNTDTGISETATSNGAGQFSFLNLNPGAYKLTTSAQGFTTSVQEHVEVLVGATVGLTVTLQPGQVKQTITVSANAAALQTQTSEISTTISPAEMENLPVSLVADMRNPLNFVILVPGVHGSVPGVSPDYRLHVSGSATNSNEIYIDGVPFMNTTDQGAQTYDHPPMDSIAQFKVINNNQPARYGFASSVVSYLFKSGTNQFHGGIFDYLQNDALNANTFDSNFLGVRKAPLKQNEYGGTLGGPVWIPKIYDGHNKTFFFFDYTGFKYRPSSNNATLTTLPNEFRQGNFSQQLGPQMKDANGNPIFDAEGRPILLGQVYNPFSDHTVIGPDGQPHVVRDPFPNNQIPTSLFSSVSQKILPNFPQATNNNLQNNFIRLQKTIINEYRSVIKIDEHISDKQALSGSYFFGNYFESTPGGLNTLDAISTNVTTKQIRLTYNYTFSPTFLNNLNIGFLRDNFFDGPLVAGPGLQALGITGMPALGPSSSFPGIGIGTVQNGIGGPGGSRIPANRYFLGDNLTLIRGRHTFTIGGEVRWLQRNERGIPAGTFTFEPTESGIGGTGFAGGQPVSIPVGTGAAAASFLFGGVDFVNFGYPSSPAFRWWHDGVYVEDDWRMTPNLTLNLGMRWDLMIPRTETHGDVSTMDPTLPNPGAGGIPGAMTFYGNGTGRNGKPRIGKIYYNNWQPRVGFAFSPGNHTSVWRGGFAINRTAGNDNLENDISGTQYTSGFSGAAVLSRPQDAIGSPAFFWDNPFPSGSVVEPGSALIPTLFLGNTNPPMIHASAGLPPTQINWTMQFQHQFSSSLIGMIGYVGMHTYHLGVWSKPNQINSSVAISKYTAAAQAAGLPLNQFLTLPISDPRLAAAGIAPPFPGFTAMFGPGATGSQALRPWPQYGDVDNPFNPIGSASYNGLQSSLQMRLAKGLTFLLSYTFSKTIGNVDSNSGPSAGAENAIFAGSFFQDYYNPRGQRSVTSSDIPNNVALSYTYQLPFGRGKALLNHGGVVNAVVGGWSVSGIQHYQSGRPIHIEYDAFGSSNPYFAAGDGFSFRPDVVPGAPLKNPAYSKSCSHPLVGSERAPCQFYINPAAFKLPPPGQFGNAPNLFSSLRMPAFINEDLSISKQVQLYENLNLQIQANFFNAFNRVIFSAGGNAQAFIINAAPPDLSTSSLTNSQTVFGIMTTQQNSPRIIQFGMKLQF